MPPRVRALGGFCLQGTRVVTTKKSVKVAVPVPAKKAVRRGPPTLSDVKLHPPVKRAPFAHLTPTDTDGVYRNSDGRLVDHLGILLNLREAKETEDEASIRIIGEIADSPAKVLRRIALDSTLPLPLRMDAAKHAAPYFDRKTPIAVENTNTDKTLDLEAIASMPADKRRVLLAELKALGVDLTGGR